MLFINILTLRKQLLKHMKNSILTSFLTALQPSFYTSLLAYSRPFGMILAPWTVLPICLRLTSVLGREMMRSIEEILAGRELITARDVLECIFIKTGRSVSLNTIAAWRAMDMPGAIQPPGQRIWYYDWPQLWDWYRTYSVNRTKKRAKIS